MEHSFHARERLNESWEKFAKEDPYTYILTSLKNGDPQEFWKSGYRTVQEELLPLVLKRGIYPGIAMEFGCGVGRLIFPLTTHFQELVGFDIAEGMIQRARQFAGDSRIVNARFCAISGPEDLLRRAGNYAGRINFLYSLLVFQHIQDLSTIQGYLHALYILLEEKGIAYLQFDTRPQNLAYQLKTTLPDCLLPRFWRRGIRRIRRSPQEIAESISHAGLEIVEELTPFTVYHRYILRRSPRQSHSS